MANGNVRWFNNAKGFGFIYDEGGDDVFFQRTALQSDRYKSLKIGQRVQFDIKQGPKGDQAANVVKR